MKLREAGGFPFESRFPPVAVAQSLLDDSERPVVVVGHRGRDRARVVDDSGDEAHPERLVGVDDAARKREFEGVTLADDARETDGPAPRAEQAESDARFAEGRPRGGHPHVAGEREFDAAAAGRSVDAGDDDRFGGFDGVGDALAVFCERLGVVEVGDAVEVRAGAERRAVPPEEDHRRVGLDDRGFEGVEVGRSERVPSRRAVDGHDPEVAVVRRPYHTPVVPWFSKGLCPPNRKSRPMDDAVRAREAAREALSDIEPEALRAALDERLDAASLTPAVLTFVSARAVEPKVDLNGMASRAAGVQLIYEGLRLTRSLAHDEPWTHLDSPEEDTDADLDILAADVLVSRGFYLLARTEAADHAVETVRAFGRDQTRRRSADEAARPDLDGELEVNICTLAVVAGTTAVGSAPPTALVEYAAGLADTHDGDFPPADETVSEGTVERIAALYQGGGGDDAVTSAADR